MPFEASIMAAGGGPARRKKKKDRGAKTLDGIKDSVRALEIELGKVSGSHTEFDLRRAVGKMVAASAPRVHGVELSPEGGRCLASVEVRSWARRFLRLSLSATSAV